MSVETRTLAPGEVERHLSDIAKLRIAVFRDWPYLYDGDLAYEEAYLRPYAESDRAVVVASFDGDALVGASTGVPLSDHDEGIGGAVVAHGYPIESVFYLAESVLLPAFRGRGIGHVFFDSRERHARDLGFHHTVFASVVRGDSDPRRPERARDLAPFWRKRGYVPADPPMAHLAWRDVGEEVDTVKPLRLWFRELAFD